MDNLIDHPGIIIGPAFTGIFMLMLDLFNKKSHIISNTEEAIWSVFWIGLSMGFKLENGDCAILPYQIDAFLEIIGGPNPFYVCLPYFPDEGKEEISLKSNRKVIPKEIIPLEMRFLLPVGKD